jgi:hypothetical protein
MRLVYIAPQRIEVRDFPPDAKPEAEIYARFVANALQAKIAEAFEQQRTASGALLGNDADYTLGKVEDGLDPRRGHRTGALQAALYLVRLWKLQASKQRVVIIFSDKPLESAIDYATYYTEAKTQGGFIAGVAKSWLASIKAPKLKLVKKRKAPAVQTLALAARVARERGRTDFRLFGG